MAGDDGVQSKDVLPTTPCLTSRMHAVVLKGGATKGDGADEGWMHLVVVVGGGFVSSHAI